MIQPQASRARQLSILFVEDDRQIRRFISMTLRSLGYDLIEVEDGVQATKIIEDGGSFDVLLTDIVLPGGIGGVEVANTYKKLSPDGRVVFSSGFLDRAAVSSSEHFADVAVLIKPYDTEMLVTAIEGQN